QRRDMDEDVITAFGGADEAEAALLVPDVQLPRKAHQSARPRRATPSLIFSTSAVAKLSRSVAVSGSLAKNGAPGTNATPCSIARCANSPASFTLPPAPVRRAQKNRPPCGSVNSIAAPSSRFSASAIACERSAYFWRTLRKVAGMRPL